MKKTFDTEKKLYTLSLLVQDIPGVLSQVARLFSRKGSTWSPWRWAPPTTPPSPA